MKKYIKKICVLLAVLMLVMGAFAVAEGVISTTVVMRVSRMTQNAVVNAGEDLSMEINIDGVTPASYQWYYEGQEIAGANQKVYSIVNAQVEDSGVYRMDAFDADGSMPVGVAAAVFAAAAAALVLVFRRKAVA